MRRLNGILLCMATVSAWAGRVHGADRFPRPEFEGGYLTPTPTVPPPRPDVYEYGDVLILALAMGLASYLVLKRRSRKGVVALMVFSLLYLGFWRHGCVCPVGSIQNVVTALSGFAYALPVHVALLFLLPLLFALCFGRVFCAAVCPLGAIQDLVAVRPVTIAPGILRVLLMAPVLYLLFAVYCAAMGVGYVVCRLDPFVGLFRFHATPSMFLYGAGVLALGVFVARPYCRFLCPYGVLLRWMSLFSKWHVTITPDECVQCRLCENACPFGAIRAPRSATSSEPRAVERRRLVVSLALVVLMTAGGAWLGVRSHVGLSRMHAVVRLAEQIVREDAGDAAAVLESEVFRSESRSVDDLLREARSWRRRFRTGSGLLGGAIGLVLAGQVVALSIRRTRRDYQPDRAHCLSCGRCFEVCPREQLRLHGAPGKQGAKA